MKIAAVILAFGMLATGMPSEAARPAEAATQALLLSETALPAQLPADRWQVWRIFGVDPAIAESIVWPEMERYWPLRDALETTADYITYTGRGGTDYSIGIFQMKPSFVEKLEKAWMGSGFADYYDLRFDVSDTDAARHGRIDRMDVGRWQVIYVGMFLRLLYSSYGSFDSAGERVQQGIDTLPIEDQVRLAANAYNRGCPFPEAGSGAPEILRRGMYECLFPRIKFPRALARKYCYTTLAWEHFQSITEH